MGHLWALVWYSGASPVPCIAFVICYGTEVGFQEPQYSWYGTKLGTLRDFLGTQFCPGYLLWDIFGALFVPIIVPFLILGHFWGLFGAFSGPKCGYGTVTGSSLAHLIKLGHLWGFVCTHNCPIVGYVGQNWVHLRAF